MADAGGVSGGEAAAVVTASSGALVVIGKGIAWVFRQRKGRIAQLEARVEALAGQHLAMIEQQSTVVRMNDCLAGVCFLLVDDIGQHRPDAPVLTQVRNLVGDYPDLLRRLFPLEPVPADMVALALRAKRTGEE